MATLKITNPTDQPQHAECFVGPGEPAIHFHIPPHGEIEVPEVHPVLGDMRRALHQRDRNSGIVVGGLLPLCQIGYADGRPQDYGVHPTYFERSAPSTAVRPEDVAERLKMAQAGDDPILARARARRAAAK